MTDTPPPPPDTPPPLIMGRSGLVELNIGGKPYTTTRQTLENSGFLRALTSGSFAAPRDAQGRIFVDRDATPAFDTMLTFLRGALGRTALDRMDLTTRAELVAEAEFYDVPALIEGAVLPPVGALVRYSQHTPPHPGAQGGYGARQGRHTLSVGRVVAYEHATRQWTIEVDSEGVIQMKQSMPASTVRLAERRLDSFRWPRRDVDCAARFLLMPWERQATSDGRALAPFSRFDAGWQWLTCYGTWIDGEALARAPAMGDAFWERGLPASPPLDEDDELTPEAIARAALEDLLPGRPRVSI